jgi:YidC/Oxa1 family membrane protein insertase
VQTDQERRTILAVGLSLLVYMVYLQWFVPPMAPVDTVTGVGDLQVAAVESAHSEPNQTVRPDSERDVASPGTMEDGAAIDGDPVVEAETVVPAIEDHEMSVETDSFGAVLHSREGALRTLNLKDYNAQPTVQPLWSHLLSKFSGGTEEWVAYEGGQDPEVLLTEDGAFLIAGAGNLGPDHQYEVTPAAGGWVATSRVNDGLQISKHYQMGSDSHLLDVVVRFENRSSRTIRDLWVGMADVSDGEDAGAMDTFANVTRPFAYVEEDIERVDDLSDLDDDAFERFPGKVDWFGLGNKYFMSVLLPQDDMKGEWVVDRLPDDRIGSFLRLTEPLESGESREFRFQGYMGPKDIDITAPVGQNLDASVEFGIFGMFAKILLIMMKYFYGLVGNWGVAIILLTMSIKAVFFPLMQKQFVSSKRMQAIQPELKALKEKYKDDQTAQTKATMELFKENQVNPMSGCLPMVIQMPVWFALYNVMLQSVEIYGSQFLYLKDLTGVDPTGVLPLLVTVLMVLQQKLMPMGSMDPMQQKMMRLMPIMFGIFMFTFPSGLVLYFSVNNLLTIAQQWFIYRKKDDVVPVPSKA